MMSAKEIPDYAYHDFWDEKPKALKPLFRLLSYIIAPFASCVMRCGDTIAVYHDTRVINTFRTTVKKLNEGNHIIIFPECKRGYNQILCAFQENFIDVAKLYYKKTGKEVCFVPMYLAPRPRMLPRTPYFSCQTLARAVTFSPISRERAARLSRSMISMVLSAAAQARGLPQKVPPTVPPGMASMISERATMALMGIPAAMDLAVVRMSGAQPASAQYSEANMRPVPAKA